MVLIILVNPNQTHPLNIIFQIFSDKHGTQLGTLCRLTFTQKKGESPYL